MTEPGASGSTRRSATVTISVPDSRSALSRSLIDRNPPVPTISREPQLRPPSSKPVRARRSSGASLDRDHDLDAGAVVEGPRLELGAGHDLAVDGDGDPARVGLGAEQQRRVADAGAVVELARARR